FCRELAILQEYRKIPAAGMSGQLEGAWTFWSEKGTLSRQLHCDRIHRAVLGGHVEAAVEAGGSERGSDSRRRHGRSVAALAQVRQDHGLERLVMHLRQQLGAGVVGEVSAVAGDPLLYHRRVATLPEQHLVVVGLQ